MLSELVKANNGLQYSWGKNGTRTK